MSLLGVDHLEHILQAYAEVALFVERRLCRCQLHNAESLVNFVWLRLRAAGFLVTV